MAMIIIGTLLAVLFASAVLIIVLLYFYQDRLLYHPAMPGISKMPETNPKGYRSPLEHKLPFEDMYIKTEDGVVLHSWLMLHQPDPREHPTVSTCLLDRPHIASLSSDHFFPWQCGECWLQAAECSRSVQKSAVQRHAGGIQGIWEE